MLSSTSVLFHVVLALFGWSTLINPLGADKPALCHTDAILTTCKEKLADIDRSDPNDYCDRYKIWRACLDNDCTGKVLDQYRYMIYSHMALDKTLRICNIGVEDFSAMKDKAKEGIYYANNKDRLPQPFDALETKDSPPKCAVMIVKECDAIFHGEFHAQPNLCTGVKDWIACYERDRKLPCNAQIINDFKQVLEVAAMDLEVKVQLLPKIDC